MEQILLIASLIGVVFFTGYLVYVTWMYGMQESISKTYYTIGERVLFTFVLWFLAIPVVMMANNGWLFAAAVSVLFVGAAPAYLGRSYDIERKVHFVASYLSVAFALMYIIITLEHLCLGVALAVYIGFAFILKPRNFIWWIEIIVIYITYVLVLLNY